MPIVNGHSLFCLTNPDLRIGRRENAEQSIQGMPLHPRCCRNDCCNLACYNHGTCNVADGQPYTNYWRNRVLEIHSFLTSSIRRKQPMFMRLLEVRISAGFLTSICEHDLPNDDDSFSMSIQTSAVPRTILQADHNLGHTIDGVVYTPGKMLPPPPTLPGAAKPHLLSRYKIIGASPERRFPAC